MAETKCVATLRLNRIHLFVHDESPAPVTWLATHVRIADLVFLSPMKGCCVFFFFLIFAKSTLKGFSIYIDNRDNEAVEKE